MRRLFLLVSARFRLLLSDRPAKSFALPRRIGGKRQHGASKLAPGLSRRGHQRASLTAGGDALQRSQRSFADADSARAARVRAALRASYRWWRRCYERMQC
jgi:hypothetical protein